MGKILVRVGTGSRWSVPGCSRSGWQRKTEIGWWYLVLILVRVRRNWDEMRLDWEGRDGWATRALTLEANSWSTLKTRLRWWASLSPHVRGELPGTTALVFFAGELLCTWEVYILQYYSQLLRLKGKERRKIRKQKGPKKDVVRKYITVELSGEDKKGSERTRNQ